MRVKYLGSIPILLLLILTISCAIPPDTTSPAQTPKPGTSPAPSTASSPVPRPTPTPAPGLSPAPRLTPETQITVTRVIDGDTIEVSIAGAIYKVRYTGIDTPELDDTEARLCTLAQEATRYNRQMVEAKTIQLEKDVSETDEYGRLLRYVYVDDIFVNAELVKLGYARVTTYPQDVKYRDLLLKLEGEAKEAGRGLWASIPPAPSPTGEAPNIQITDIFYDGIVPRVESDEYVEITNLGGQPQDLAGWVLKDISEGYPSFTFPSYILSSDKSIRVYTNEYHPEWGAFSFEYSRAVWNNTEPDVAVLYDNHGIEISRKSY